MYMSACKYTCKVRLYIQVSNELRSLLRESVPYVKCTDKTPNTYVQS